MEDVGFVGVSFLHTKFKQNKKLYKIKALDQDEF